MTFAEPLALFFLLGVPLIVVFYLLRVRLHERVVSSTYLWERLLRDLTAQDPWQKPRFTALMLIQMLLLATLAFALARPVRPTLALESEFAVVVLDASASMQAVDISPNRFDEARRQAEEAVRALPEGSAVTLIAAASRPEVLVPATQDRGRIVNALATARATAGRLDAVDATELAHAIIGGRPNGHVYVFSDGAFDWALDRGGHAGSMSLRTTTGGSSNRAITTIAARPDPLNNRQFQVFARVRNYAASEAPVTLSLYADGALVDSRALTIAAHAAQEIIIERLPAEAEVVEVRLLENDDLALDNTAFIVLERQRPIKMLLVSEGNVFAERALLSLPQVDLFQVTPRRYGSIDVGAYDIILFDGFLPTLLPRQNLLVINPPDSPLLTVDGSLRRPRVSTWESKDSLLRFVSGLDELQIQRSAKIIPPNWAKTLVAAGGSPLILAGERDGRRIVVLGFDLHESNLPLLAAFPILASNAVGYLEPAHLISQRSTRAGDSLMIQPLPQAEEVIIQSPDGTTTRSVGGNTIHYDRTNQVGMYVVDQRAANLSISTEQFAVNLVDDDESDIAPRAAQGEGPGGTAEPSEAVPVNRDLWPWLVMSAIGFLAGEWWWYHRRA